MKHSLTAVILTASLIFLPCCLKERHFDTSELSLRLAQLNERYAFSFENLLIEGNVTRVYYSLTFADDTLLSLTADDSGTLTRAEFTVLSEGASENLLAEYESYCAALTSAFLSVTEESARTLCTDAGLLSREDYFSDNINITEFGRYKLRLWSCPLSMSFIITYNSETLRASD